MLLQLTRGCEVALQQMYQIYLLGFVTDLGGERHQPAAADYQEMFEVFFFLTNVFSLACDSFSFHLLKPWTQLCFKQVMKSLITTSLVWYIQAKAICFHDALGIRRGGRKRKTTIPPFVVQSSAAALLQCAPAHSGSVNSITDRGRIIKPTIIRLECSPSLQLPHHLHHIPADAPLFISKKKFLMSSPGRGKVWILLASEAELLAACAFPTLTVEQVGSFSLTTCFNFCLQTRLKSYERFQRQGWKGFVSNDS